MDEKIKVENVVEKERSVFDDRYRAAIEFEQEAMAQTRRAWNLPAIPNNESSASELLSNTAGNEQQVSENISTGNAPLSTNANDQLVSNTAAQKQHISEDISMENSVSPTNGNLRSVSNTTAEKQRISENISMENPVSPTNGDHRSITLDNHESPHSETNASGNNSSSSESPVFGDTMPPVLPKPATPIGTDQRHDQSNQVNMANDAVDTIPPKDTNTSQQVTIETEDKPLIVQRHLFKSKTVRQFRCAKEDVELTMIGVNLFALSVKEPYVEGVTKIKSVVKRELIPSTGRVNFGEYTVAKSEINNVNEHTVINILKFFAPEFVVKVTQSYLYKAIVVKKQNPNYAQEKMDKILYSAFSEILSYLYERSRPEEFETVDEIHQALHRCTFYVKGYKDHFGKDKDHGIRLKHQLLASKSIPVFHAAFRLVYNLGIPTSLLPSDLILRFKNSQVNTGSVARIKQSELERCPPVTEPNTLPYGSFTPFHCSKEEIKERVKGCTGEVVPKNVQLKHKTSKNGISKKSELAQETLRVTRSSSGKSNAPSRFGDHSKDASKIGSTKRSQKTSLGKRGRKKPSSSQDSTETPARFLRSQVSITKTSESTAVLAPCPKRRRLSSVAVERETKSSPTVQKALNIGKHPSITKDTKVAERALASISIRRKATGKGKKLQHSSKEEDKPKDFKRLQKLLKLINKSFDKKKGEAYLNYKATRNDSEFHLWIIKEDHIAVFQEIYIGTFSTSEAVEHLAAVRKLFVEGVEVKFTLPNGNRLRLSVKDVKIAPARTKEEKATRKVSKSQKQISMKQKSQ